MAETSGPFDYEPDGETPQETSENLFSRILGVAVPDGVHMSGLALSGGGSDVVLSGGAATIQGYGYLLDEAKAFSVPFNMHPTYNRVDRVILRLDKSNNQITSQYIQGTPGPSSSTPFGSIPAPPMLTRTANVFDVGLGMILRRANGNPSYTIIPERMTALPALTDYGTSDVFSAYNLPNGAMGFLTEPGSNSEHISRWVGKREDGLVDILSKPPFQVFEKNSTEYAVSPGGSWQTISGWNRAEGSPGDSPHLQYTTGGMIIGVTGWYTVSFSITFTDDGGTGNRAVRMINTTTGSTILRQNNPHTTSRWISVSGTRKVFLRKGQTILLQAQNTASSGTARIATGASSTWEIEYRWR